MFIAILLLSGIKEYKQATMTHFYSDPNSLLLKKEMKERKEFFLHSVKYMMEFTYFMYEK